MARARKPKVNRDEWGSVTRLPDGAWRLRYQGPDGKRRDGGRYRTRLEAEDARARLRASILGGTWRPATSTGSPLLADYAAAWLQRAELSEQLSPRTVVLYRRMFERLVLPDLGGIELGRVPVGRLTRETVMAWDLVARSAGSTVPLTGACQPPWSRPGRTPALPPHPPLRAGGAAGIGSSNRPARRCPRCVRARSRTATCSSTRCGCARAPEADAARTVRHLRYGPSGVISHVRVERALVFTTTTGQPVRCHHRSQAIARTRTAVPGAEHLTWHGLRHNGSTLAA